MLMLLTKLEATPIFIRAENPSIHILGNKVISLTASHQARKEVTNDNDVLLIFLFLLRREVALHLLCKFIFLWKESIQ